MCNKAVVSDHRYPIRYREHKAKHRTKTKIQNGKKLGKCDKTLYNKAAVRGQNTELKNKNIQSSKKLRKRDKTLYMYNKAAVSGPSKQDVNDDPLLMFITENILMRKSTRI